MVGKVQLGGGDEMNPNNTRLVIWAEGMLFF